jgi:hypothetical protein
MRRRLLWALGIGALLAGDAWAQIPLGPEFPVNTYTTSQQNHPAIASDAAGNFVVVWQSLDQDGNGPGVFARKYSAAGTPLGSSEFRVNGITAGYQGAPAVASDPTGRFVVAWHSDNQEGSSFGVFARQFDAAGVPGPEFQVNTYTTASQGYPAVAMDAGGSFVVTWWGQAGDGDADGVFAQRYNAAGVPQGGEFRVNTYTTSNQLFPSVAMDPAGDFAIAWSSAYQDGSGSGVFGQRYNAAGVPQGSEFRANSYTAGSQSKASVAMDAGGGFLVVWQSSGQDGDAGGVFGRRYNPAGVPQGSEFQVNEYTTDYQQLPHAVRTDDGGFVVAWASYLQDGSGNGVFARTLGPSGVRLGSEFRVNTYTTSQQLEPVMAPQPGGRFVVSWPSLGQDGSGYGVFGARFRRDVIFQDGFESGGLSAWSSSATDGGDLFPSVLAAMKFTGVGLQGQVDDTASLFVQDDTPVDEDRYRARFYVNTNDFDPGEASGAHRTRIFIVFEEAPTRRLAAIVLKRSAGAYSVMGRARLDDDTQADTGFFDIAAGVHFVELDWKRSSSPSANDGTFELWIDGVSRSTLSGLDNSRSAVDFVRLGALSVKTGASGTLYWDEFESRRISFIGN